MKDFELGTVFEAADYDDAYSYVVENNYTIERHGETQFIIANPENTTQDILNQREIADLKSKLADTDYIVLKIAETESVLERETLREKYAEQLANRKVWRERINELEKDVDNLSEYAIID